MEINAHDYVHPLQAGERNGLRFTIRSVIGSAFSIGDGYFLTCAHVIDNGSSYKNVSVGKQNSELGMWEAIEIESIELNHDIDLALLYAPKFESAHTRVWRVPENLPMLTKIHCTGFPFALNYPGDGSIQIRAFEGTISSKTNWSDFKANPEIYELSHVAPRGLSGAPLCVENQIVGVIFGNRSIEITVFSEKEIEIESGSTNTYEKIEALRIGLALQAIPVLCTHYKLLDGTIAMHLEKNSLLHNK